MMKKVLLGFLLLISVTFLFVNIKNYKTEIVDSEDLAVYVNDELVSSIPKKGEAMFIKSVCDNDAKASWDNDNWGLLVTNMSKRTKCNLYFYQGDTVFNFDYTGGEQVFTVPVSGTYKLETWGAQGGTWANTVIGGAGGYSTGEIFLNIQDELYLIVGKKNENRLCDPNSCIGGGGASYILNKVLGSGNLYEYSDNLSNIIIVSGGGGGSEWNGGYGGSGGGFKGNSGNRGGLNNSYSITPTAEGGTQHLGGNSTKIDSHSKTTEISNGLFGKGGYTIGGDGGGQGGIGYYGGGASDFAGGGGGGSGYIGNPLLKDKAMYCYNCEESSDESTKTISTTCSEETPMENCAKKGNGYARITLVSIDE